jgi:hypothetical protein
MSASHGVGRGLSSFAIAVLLAGCGSAVSTPTPAPTPTIVATPTPTPGPPGLVWMGVWSDSTKYLPTDVVFYNGSAYVTMSETTAVPPSAPWELVAAKGDTGATGAKGDTGATGPAGPGSVLHTQIVTNNWDIPGHTANRGQATCPSSWFVTGGGYYFVNGWLAPYASRPVILTSGINLWEVWAYNPDAVDVGGIVYAVCAHLQNS